MKKFFQIFTAAITICFFSAFTVSAQNAWINEIHYDNAGADVDETVEVVIENAGSYTLSDFQIDLYNGSSSSLSVYNTKTLDVYTVGNTVNNFTIYYLNYTAAGGSIQNGAPDGLCLSYQGVLIAGQFLSYEGTFTAADGPAIGLTSTDIGVSETSSTPVGMSLQLSGTGTAYPDFTWQPPDVATSGALNNNQNFSGTVLPEPDNYPTNFMAAANGITIDLTWTDATGTQLPSAYLIKVSDQNNITLPVDGTFEPDDTDLSDGTGALNVPFGDEMCTFFRLNGETEYFFKIFPYTNAGANVDFKTDGTPPAASATTDAIVSANDFESGDFGTWDTISVASDKNWAVLNYGGALGTTHFAQMNGYQENEPSNDWLISPALDLTAYISEQMVFYTMWKYGDVDNELTLKYSTDYTGGDPMLATWTELPFNKAVSQDTWEHSGDIDLSGISNSNVYVAFQYLSSGNPRRWNVDEIAITGHAIVPIISVTSPVTGDIWEQGTAHDITWTASNTQPNVMIELTTDASNPTPTWTTLIASVPASQGSWTWNISPTQQASNDCQIRVSEVGGSANALSGIFEIIEPVYIPALVINEIMYNPPESGTDSLEYIELYNNDNITIELDGYYFDAGVTYTFPDIDLLPGDYLVVAVDSVVMLNTFGVTAYNWTSGGLSNGGELIQINNSQGFLVDSVYYDDAPPWPTGADGDGPSLVLCDPDSDNSDGANWSVSQLYQGTNAIGDSIWGSPGMENCLIAPDPDFVADNTSITTGGAVNFTDLTVGEPTTWTWTFIGGDPGSHNGQNPPPIVYNTPGTYSVSLYVENVVGGNTETKTDYITVGSFPTADFEASDEVILVGNSIDFTDLSLGEPTSWSWTFEGGTPGTSTEQYPTGILYDTEGSFDVTLIVENGSGTDTLVKADYIAVGYVPVADFEASDDTIYIGETIDFTDLSLNNPDTWSWTFEGGDPGISSQQNPSAIMYNAEGTYDVTLMVESIFGSDTLTKEDMIIVVDPVGIKEFNSWNFKIYPNPGNGVFYIEKNTTVPLDMQIYSITGQLVKSIQMNNMKMDADLTELNKGIYFIRMIERGSNVFVTKKLVIY